jgi:hypothetical protein
MGTPRNTQVAVEESYSELSKSIFKTRKNNHLYRKTLDLDNMPANKELYMKPKMSVIEEDISMEDKRCEIEKVWNMDRSVD